MSVFHKIKSLSFSSFPPFFDLSSIYLQTPVSLQVREISGQTIEDFFLGRNPRFPFLIKDNPCKTDGFQGQILTQRILSDIEEVLYQLNPLYHVGELKNDFIQIQSVDEKEVVHFCHRIYEMVQKEITWLNNFIQNNPPLQQTNIVEQSLPQLVLELTVLAESAERILETIRNESQNLITFLQLPMETDSNEEQNFSYCTQTNYSSIVVSVNNLREIVNCFVGKRLTTMWNYQKQLETVGIPFANPLILEEISPQCQRIYCSIFSMLEIWDFEIKKGVHQGQFDQLGDLFKKALGYFEIFLNSTFFVYQQPPLVIPMLTKMCTKQVSKDDPTKEESLPVSTCLVAAAGINARNKTMIHLINEEHARTLYRSGLETMMNEIVTPVTFNIGDARRNVNYASNRNIEVVEFEGAILESRHGEKKSRSCSKKVGCRVVEEKCCVLFIVEVKFFDHRLQIWTTSLPVSVSSHGVQKSLGIVVIIRDYLTAGMIRTPFEIPLPGPDYITLDEISKVILCLFRKYLGDEKLQITQSDLICIRRKAVEAAQIVRDGNVINFTGKIKWDSLSAKVFTRPKIESREISEIKFGFWDWVYAALKTIQLPRVKILWEKGFLRFIDKNHETAVPNGFVENFATAESELISAGGIAKIFLLRFSDKFPGSISIVYFGDDGLVHHNAPFMYHEVKENLLANEIRSDSRLLYIHGFGTESTKDELLKDFYPINDKPPGYE